MRPNFPSQRAQRFAAPFRRCCGLLSIFASSGPRVDNAWWAPLVRRRTSHTREVWLRDRSGLPSLAAYRDTARRVSLSCAASQGEAIDFFAVTGVVCRWGTYVIPTVGIIAVALNLFGRDRGHFATCNRLFQQRD